MARPNENWIEKTWVSLDLPDPMVDQIDILLSTGLWGRNRAEIIEKLAAYALTLFQPMVKVGREMQKKVKDSHYAIDERHPTSAEIRKQAGLGPIDPDALDERNEDKF